MSAVNSIQSQMTTSFAASSAGIGASSSSSTASDVSQIGGPGGALSVQTSTMLSSTQGNASIENLAALAMALLLSKSNEAKNDDDAWKMLVGMAMLGGMANQGESISMQSSFSAVQQSYAPTDAAAVAGGGLNMQG